MFNKTIKTEKKNIVTNDAGGKSYELNKELSLFLEALAFKPKNSFYRNMEDKFNSLVNTFKFVYKKDKEYTYALAWYLGKIMGLRLSPVILNSLGVMYGGAADSKNIEKVVNEVYTRPDFIANSCGLIKDLSKFKSIGQLPEFYRTILRNKLQTFSEHTLKNRKMRTREIKLKDLIKVLRPIPNSENMSKLYKDIIEDGPLSKLTVEINENTGEINSSKIVTILSEANKNTSKITQKQVQQALSKNIDKWAINELIRNISQFSNEDTPALIKRFNKVIDNGDWRFINPFDLMLINVDLPEGIKNVFNTLIEKIIEVEKESRKKNILVLLDKSGSMHGGKRYKIASKYLTMFKDYFAKNNLDFYRFDTSIEKIDISKYLHYRPINFAEAMCNIVCTAQGGTAIYDSLARALQNESKQYDSVFIITDEESWADEHHISRYQNILNNYNLINKVILINCSQTNKSIFKADNGIARCAGEDGKIIYMINALYNWKSFKKKYIMDPFKNIK